MKIKGKINGKCVTLEIKNCETQAPKAKRIKSFFDESKAFIKDRYETIEDVRKTFSTDILQDLIRKRELGFIFRKDLTDTVSIRYQGNFYHYQYTTGLWTNGDGFKYYFASSTHRFLWDYILRDDAKMIKSSFATKMAMIKQLELL